jgi:two-component system response regulator AtoC
MVTINCGGIPGNLLESELFGYKKGAFTDAGKDKPGRFEEAHAGTIFLDEIGELPLPLQVKLLRVLQEEEITPLGATGSTTIDVRVIAATARDLNDEVKKGGFREDLFYRINVLTIHLPPLRERPEDISLLVDHFMERFDEKLGRHIRTVSPEALNLLMDYPWPGNVRELENVLERAVLLCRGEVITPEDLPSSIQVGGDSEIFSDPENPLSIKKASRRMERELIKKALSQTHGNRTQASKLLEISRPMLISKIKEYGLE